MEIPKFLKCPECDEKYDDKKKRRIIDSCGHPRCFSCLTLDSQCTVCETILGRRRSSLVSSRDSLLSTGDVQDQKSTNQLFSKGQYLRLLYSYDPANSQELPRRRERARTLSNEKLLEGLNGELGGTRHQRFMSDSVATFTGMFRKDSYMKTLYSYDPTSKEYSMEEKIRKYRSLEILSDRTRNGSISSDASTETFMSAMHERQERRSLNSSVDELDDGSPKSPSSPTKKGKLSAKVWPSCPELSIQENIWQMRQPAIERRNRPSSLYQMKFSNNSPRSSMYSPRSSGYWSELEQLSESESFSTTPKQPESPNPLSQVPSPLSQEKISSDDVEAPKRTCSPAMTSSFEGQEQGKTDAWKVTRGVFQRYKPNRTRSSECLTEPLRIKTIQRINSMPVERHTKKISENNTQRRAFMTDV